MCNKIYFLITLFLIIILSCDSKEKNISISADDKFLFDQALHNGILASEGFARCDRFVEAWLQHSDPETGLIPRNIKESKDFWNAKDAAADNYPFMVLTSFFTNQGRFEGRMMDILNSETELTSRVGSLPDTYSFSKKGFLNEDVQMGQIVFGASEYIKDGLLPLTEWLGKSAWSERMIDMLNDLENQIEIAGDISESGFGSAPQEEVNGELLQTLSRVYWMTGGKKFLDWAIKIGDFYLLGDHHPTRDLEYLRLRDHGCELVSGLCELYITVSFADKDKKEDYQEPLYEMLDRILEVGRNEDGFFYDGINPQTGEIVHERIADNWGYTLNGFYGIYLVDSKEEYREPIFQLFSNLHKYRNHNWEGNADGYADAIESALNLYNRIPDPAVASWIDSEIQVMWAMQNENGIIEGWHGDGNFARTTIMYNLWKSKGLYAKPWREDLILGAEQNGDSLLITIQSQKPWNGKLYFDKQRFKNNMNLPLDWPRINQFPEWFTAQPEKDYQMVDYKQEVQKLVSGKDLINGIDFSIDGEHSLLFF